MKKHSGLYKRGALALVLAGALAMTGCYIQPDNTQTGSNVDGGGQDPFFDPIPPTSTPAPTATPRPDNQQGAGQVNWNDDWGVSLSTNQPSAATTQPGTAPTPGGGTIVLSTPKPTNAPAATTKPAGNTSTVNTSTVLKSGSEGSLVKQLQQRLKELGYLTGTADGKYGSATTKAVRDFQANNGLNVDGVAGKNTLVSVYSDNAKAKTADSITAKPAGTATPKPTAKPTATPDWNKVRYLELGSSGTDVKKLQNRLKTLGYLSGTASGSFDAATDAALRAFQARAGLTQDGVAGPDTQKKLYASNAAKASSTAATVGKALESGSSGAGVKTMQQALKDLGYYTGSVDGSFGSGTQEAVKAFQQNNGLSVDGKAGTQTLTKLYSDDAVKASGGVNGGTSSGGYTTLREGDEGASVKKLQQQLKTLGYYSGSVDGKYGSGTVTAVTTFQKLNKITADGIAGPTTQRLLFGGNATANEKYSTLEQYNEGTAVKNLQYALYELGYYQGKRNGIYNEDTVNAVREFQMNNGLTVDGKAGVKTQELLYSTKAKPAASGSGGEGDGGTFATLRKGDRGDSVVQLQDALYQLGYMTVNDITGSFDSATFSAVQEFQRTNGLTVDGVAGNDTLQRLYSSAARKKQ